MSLIDTRPRFVNTSPGSAPLMQAGGMSAPWTSYFKTLVQNLIWPNVVMPGLAPNDATVVKNGTGYAVGNMLYFTADIICSSKSLTSLPGVTELTLPVITAMAGLAFCFDGDTGWSYGSCFIPATDVKCYLPQFTNIQHIVITGSYVMRAGNPGSKG